MIFSNEINPTIWGAVDLEPCEDWTVKVQIDVTIKSSKAEIYVYPIKIYGWYTDGKDNQSEFLWGYGDETFKLDVQIPPIDGDIFFSSLDVDFNEQTINLY